jgi:hypothetical protein
MTKNRCAISAISVLVLLALGLLVYPSSAFPQGAPSGPQVISDAVANEPIAFDISPPLSQMINAPVSAAPGTPRGIPLLRPKLQQLMQASPAAGGGGAFQPSIGPPIGATIGLNFDGVAMTNNTDLGSTLNCGKVLGFLVAPPDTNLAVGDTQVVQWVNLCYAVFDKATGALLAGPFPGSQFWGGFASTCEFRNDGDPIIQFDKANHRWVASQNVFGPFLTCIAISQTADATGSYFRYQFPQPGFPDYPKWGLTPKVYYQTQNDFGVGTAFVGVNVCAYDATKMLVGNPRATQLCILDNSNGTLFDDSMLPADNDSVPPAGAPAAPEVLLGSIDNPGFNNAVYEYVFTVVSFKGKGKATLAGVNGTMPISVPKFNLACGGFGACIPQPGVPDLLDALGDRLMYRLARFDDGTNQHFLVTHSVSNTSATAARWYEFRAPSGSTILSRYQSGQTPDDLEFRWMGSVAYDKFGDIALGYSRSRRVAGDYPSLYLSGQTAGEPAGTTDTESLIFAGLGSQTGTANRWGDYSRMALDGADSCSFWYTTEYYPATAAFAWNTRIAGKIKFPSCP